jgi:1-deoxy-D-xylulose-5-phosphate reductoisomerase
LNAANEELVAGFLAGHTRFVDIPSHLETVMRRHRNYEARTLEDVLEADQWARVATRELIASAPQRIWA